MPVRNVSIHLRSVIDGDEAHYDYQGEYRRKTGSHNIVYTDYTGNEITKVAIEAAENAMLLHRVGGITADMLFDPLAETVVKYDNPKVNFKAKYRDDRFQSDFCYKSKVKQEFETIMQFCKTNKINLVISYSNKGLISVAELKEISKTCFENVVLKKINYKHSTQGKGTQDLKEIILVCSN